MGASGIRLLLVERDGEPGSVRERIDAWQLDYELRHAAVADQLPAALAAVQCVLVSCPSRDPLTTQILAMTRSDTTPVPVVVIADDADAETAVSLLKSGAVDYLSRRTLTRQNLVSSIQHALTQADSDRKAVRMEEAVRASQESLDTTLRSIGDAVLTIDSAGAITYVNPAAENLLGQGAEALNGAPLVGVLPLPHAPRESLLASLLGAATQGDRNSELLLQHGEQGPRLVEYRFDMLMGPDRATPAGAVITLKDITERRRDQLRTEFLAELGPVLTSAHTIGDVVESACRMVAAEHADACGICIMDRATFELTTAASPISTRGHFEEQLSARIGADLGRSVQAYFTETESPTFMRRAEEVLAFIDSARHRGVLQLLRPKRLEVDSRFADALARRIELALDNAWLLSQLAKAVQVRDDLLAVVSHDLRSPLSALALVADGMREELSEHAEAHQYADAIDRSVTNMNRLIQDLLDAEALAAGKLSVEFQPVVPTEVLEDCRLLFEQQASEKGLAFTVRADGELPTIQADGHRLLQVLSNLLGNAVKFTTQGTVTLSAFRTTNGVRFTVADTGPGIPAQHVPLLFDRFWRGEGSGRGVGLGLAIARGIVHAHGSELVVVSKLGEGTRFEFEVALAPE